MSTLRTYSIALCLCVPLFVSGQEVVEDRQCMHFVGLNATGLLQSVLNSEDDAGDFQYLATYDWDMGKMHLRAALGPEFASTNTTHEGFTDREETTYFSLNSRIGIGFDLLDNTKWYVTSGVDAVGRYVSDISTVDTGFDAVSDEEESYSVGAGPFILLGYRISKRVSISTEAGFYVRYAETTVTETFENFPDFNNELSKTTGWALDTYLPSAIFIQFHF